MREKISTVLTYAIGVVFLLLVGGAVFEHTTITSVWTQAPPESLAMFRGPYPAAIGRFWMTINPLALGLAVAALAVSWPFVERRRALRTALSIHAAILVVTAAYFLPEIRTLVDPGAALAPAEWKARGDLWFKLTLVRTAVALVAATFYVRATGRSTVREAASQAPARVPVAV